MFKQALPDVFAADFLCATDDGRRAYQDAITQATQVVIRDLAALTGPYQGPAPHQLAQLIASIDICPEQGHGLGATLDLVGRLVLRNSIMVSDTACLGHLHCPPLIPALAAESLISAANQSMDSWDQAPAATLLEQRVIDWLTGLLQLGAQADGIFTSGGTQSNFMGLLLARDVYAKRHLGWHTQDMGLPPEAGKFRILCSEDAHFTVQQSAAILGLGNKAVVAVPTDAQRRMDAGAASRIIDQMHQDGLIPIAIAATAGTTDFGAIDPLPALAELAQRHGLWLHVDAAYGGALALSARHRQKLAGLELADSVTMDFHKLFYQPISCSAFLTRDRAAFDTIRLHADYLNPEGNEASGMPDLVTKSIQTTRRFDGLKPFMTLHAMGRERLAQMIDTTIDVSAQAAAVIDADPELELALPPAINALLLRFRTAGLTPSILDAVNTAVQQRLLLEGQAMLAKTKFQGRVFLKITLLNPRTSLTHIETILAQLKNFAHQEAGRLDAGAGL